MKLSALPRLMIAAAFALAASCLTAQTAVADSRPDLVIAVNKLPRSLEPAMQMGNVDVRVNYNIFDTLIRRDFLSEDKGGAVRLVPGLATAWKRIGPTTLELELRQGVRFHDGTEFTADDVVFSFGKERIFGDKAPARSARLFIGDLDRVEKLGTHKIRVVMKAPDPIIEHRLAGYGSWIVSKKAYEQHRKDGEPVEIWMAAAVKKVTWNPVGTGPYKFKEYVAGDRVALTANDGYFLGKPQAKSVTFKEVPEVSTRIAGLVSGEFDMVVEIPPDQLPVLEKYSDVRPASVILENSHVLTFNTKHPVMSDKKLRQALALAIDRKKLIDTLWRGKTITPNGNQMRNFGEYYIKDFPAVAYDPAKAKKLLAQSSYKGQTIEYRIIPNYYTNSMEAAQIIQEMWKAIGFNMKITAVENWKAIRGPDVAIYPWSNTFRYPEPVGQISMSWGPGSEIQTGDRQYWDGTPEFNRLSGILTSSLDKQERKESFRRMMEIFQEEVPGTILYNPISTYAMRKGIEFTPYSLYYMDFRPDNLKIAHSN
jgi:peptide/nickel transport system substrate-binding protein